MRNSINRIVTLLLVAMMSLAVLTACGKRECDLCGKEANTTSMKIGSEKRHLCEECYEFIEELQELSDALS